MRTLVAAIMVLLALVLTAVAVPAIWADRHVVQEDGFVAMAAPLGSDTAFQQALADDVADLRASTPTDAAKRIVPDVAEERARVQQARGHLHRRIHSLIERETERLHQLHSRPVLADPAGMVTVRGEDISRLRSRARSAIGTGLDRHTDNIRHLLAQVTALSPQKTLNRGYAVVQLADGTVVRSPDQVSHEAALRIRVAAGEFAAVVAGPASMPLPTETLLPA